MYAAYMGWRSSRYIPAILIPRLAATIPRLRPRKPERHGGKRQADDLQRLADPRDGAYRVRRSHEGSGRRTPTIPTAQSYGRFRRRHAPTARQKRAS